MVKQFTKAIIIATLCNCLCLLAIAQSSWKMQPSPLQTRWAKNVTPSATLQEYPRPQMIRSNWENLNGIWNYTITEKDAPIPTTFNDQILVPFPLESALSGVKKPLLPSQRLWYKRTIKKPEIKNNEKVLLHFGAVDWEAIVYINGQKIGDHTGGYFNFSFDITSALKNGDNELIVGVYDPSDEGPNPHGKQVLKPANILYTASSGIWQTVWMETVPAIHIASLKMTPAPDHGYLSLQVNVPGDAANYTVQAIAQNNGATIGNTSGKANASLQVPVPDPHLWSPNDPFLYDLTVKLLYKNKVIDTVRSYFGMRKIEIKKDEKGQDRIFLNNKYTYNLGVLDQGFWPDGLYTAPTDEALKFDVLAIKSMGFNTVRKHVKVEPARWYYHCDKEGILVWQDMVTCANETATARKNFEKENIENVTQLYNYPSIICWVLFNEGWARYDQQRLTEAMKKMDPSRIVDGHTGENYDRGSPNNPLDKWISSDMTDIHDYPGPGIPPALPGKARVLGEWGGVQVKTPQHQWNDADGWGYISIPAAAFTEKYSFLNKHLKILEEEGLSGSIYTEPFDVETEENGLISYDREIIKIPVGKLRQIHGTLVPPTSDVAANFTVRDIDTTNPDNKYAALLDQYRNGKKDQIFLRDLAQMALRVNDKTNAARIAEDYISQLHQPLTANQWSFINKFTNSSKDKGFSLIQQGRDEMNRVLGNRKADVKLMTIVYQEIIEPHVKSPDANPDWNSMEEKSNQYGPAGEEIFLRAKTIHLLNKQDWNSFASTADRYVDKFAANISAQELNNYAWSVFENLSDATHLSNALAWSKLCIQQGDEPSFIDTYANVLYKSGNKADAITYEEKALKLAPDNEKKTYQDTLEKMRKGEKTWK
ncbi:glycoside hydrolase family 2 [Chitinophaga sp. Mgbs1]|uniref:Glycoside hydrolase family 2 n=1 Tax=Chitinophaga solisilvae TaxID=1233460 RepID=A0A3S1AVM4_9BACT|nr:glycoside hydrolase family 2 [Chitinophaga solisilvae]